jgi:hypothetical protein
MEGGAQRFTDQLVSSAQRFAQLVECREMKFQVGRQVVTVVVPEAEILVCRALEQTLLPAVHQESAVTVYLVDERYGPIRPDAFWGSTALQKNGVVRHDNSDHIDIAFESSSKSLSVLDRKRCVAVVLLSSIADYLPWALACPFRLVFSWMVDMFGGDLFHAAVIESRGVGLAIIGRSGAGKSTLSLAAAQTGEWRLLSDDFMLWSDEERAFPISTTVKMTEATARLLQLVHVASTHTELYGKYVLPACMIPGVKMIDDTPVHAVVALNFGDEAHVLTVSPNQLLSALVLHTLVGTLGGGPRTLHRMKQFLGNRRCYEMTLVPDVRRNVATLNELANTLRTSGS